MKRVAFVICSVFLFSLVISAGWAQEEDPTSYENRLTNNVSWGGYYEFEYEDVEGAGNHGDYDQHRNILFFGAQPHERIKFFNELEIEHGGHPDVKFEQAWVEFAMAENHNLRAGIDLIPVGRLNLEHDGNLRDFVFRPQTDGLLIPTTWFESGVAINGSIGNQISYQIGHSNGLNSASASDTGTRSEFESMVSSDLDESDDNGSKAVWGRLTYSPLLGTEIGLSGYNTKYDANGDSSITFVALDWKSIQGPLEVKGEYVTVTKDQQTPNSLKGGSGGYVELAYHFFPDMLRDSFIASGFDNPTFTALGRYEDLTFDEASGGAEQDFSYTSIGLNYRPMEQVAYKFSYDMDNEADDNVDNQNRFGFGVVVGF